MAEKFQHDTRPVPDPTSLTTEALRRDIGSLKDLLESKIDGHKQLNEERFKGIEQQFAQVEKLRLEQKSDTSKAVDAALAAMTKLLESQRAEAGTTKDATYEKIDNNKSRITTIETSLLTGSTSTNESRAQQNWWLGWAVGVGGLVIAIVSKWGK
jgi:hypothetical protein